MSTRILLLRHATHDLIGRALAGRMRDFTISEAGRAQARALVEPLARMRPGALYSSPQPRARDTVQPLAQRLGMEVHIDPAFDEIDFGEWTGLTFDALHQRGEPWREWVERRSAAHPPGGEAFAAVVHRACAGVQALAERHPDQTVLIASHGDPIKAVLASHLGISLDHLERFEVDCASLSVLEVAPGWSRVSRVNQPLA